MLVRHFRSVALLVAVGITPLMAACDNNATGVPYRELGREMAGVYTPATNTADLNMRLVLGTRHSVTGRYEDDAGTLRFYGNWSREGGRLVVNLTTSEGLPSGLQFDITQEKILTEIPRGPFSMTPETAPPVFLIQDVMRLRTAVTVNGETVDIDLIRVLTDIGGGSGGPTQQSITPNR